MPQISSWTIPNSGGSTYRAAVNTALAAVQSSSSGTAAPSPTVAGMLWYDTTNSILKRRNTANTGWIDVSADTLAANTFWGNPTGSAAAATPMTAAQARTILAPGQAVVAGTATDINATTYALLGSSPDFGATSTIAFVACSLVANKSAAANIVQVEGRLWNVTVGAAHGASAVGAHGQPATSSTVSSSYSAHAGILIGSLTVGNVYRLDVRALKVVAEGPLAVNSFTGSVFNL